ncbi:MAG: protoporphyrinogen oxidase [Rhodothermaceae bacterium]|nr:MAG: protoporphyrinogen oxidase [Rhodothermaceae bacterium]
MRPFRIVIAGGGITGLAAAYRLQELARTHGLPLELHLFERDARLGGKILTERTGGFIVEAGPDIFLARKPAALDLCRELGLADRLRPTCPVRRGSYIRRGNRLYALPEGLSGLVPARLWPLIASPLLSPWGKLRLVLDTVLPARSGPPVPGGSDDESVAAFFTRRLGREAYERLVEPLLGGIYGGDGEQLSLRATFPRLRELERAHGSLIRGLKARPEHTTPESAFLSLAGGMAELTGALAAALTGVHVAAGRCVEAVEPAGGGYRIRAGGTSLEAEAVLLATPAYVSARLVAPFAPALAGELAAIPYGSIATLSLAYRLSDVPHPLDAYGYIIPRTEATPVLACTWSSSKLPERTPEGHALLRVFIAARAGNDDLLDRPDEALLALARDELRATLGLTAVPVFHRLYRWQRAMPQYVLGHPERLDRIARHLDAHPGLYLAGAGYRGVGIPDCIRDAEHAARQIAAWCQSRLQNVEEKP